MRPARQSASSPRPPRTAAITSSTGRPAVGNREVVGHVSPVAHAGVLHAQDLGVLGAGEPAVDDLADEERGRRSRPVADLAREPGHGLVEHRRAGGPVVDGEAVERARLGVVLDGLGELADDGPVVAGDGVEREGPAVGDELVGDRGLLDLDADSLGSKLTWVAQLRVIRLRRSPARLPTT